MCHKLKSARKAALSLSYSEPFMWLARTHMRINLSYVYYRAVAHAVHIVLLVPHHK